MVKASRYAGDEGSERTGGEMVVAVGDRRARPSRRTVASQSVSQSGLTLLPTVRAALLVYFHLSVGILETKKQALTEHQVRRESICGD